MSVQAGHATPPEDSTDGSIAGTGGLPRQSLFFLLPRELRDKVSLASYSQHGRISHSCTT
jgi:hypothetical protein